MNKLFFIPCSFIFFDFLNYRKLFFHHILFLGESFHCISNFLWICPTQKSKGIGGKDLKFWWTWVTRHKIAQENLIKLSIEIPWRVMKSCIHGLSYLPLKSNIMHELKFILRDEIMVISALPLLPTNHTLKMTPLFMYIQLPASSWSIIIMGEIPALRHLVHASPNISTLDLEAGASLPIHHQHHLSRVHEHDPPVRWRPFIPRSPFQRYLFQAILASPAPWKFRRKMPKFSGEELKDGLTNWNSGRWFLRSLVDPFGKKWTGIFVLLHEYQIPEGDFPAPKRGEKLFLCLGQRTSLSRWAKSRVKDHRRWPTPRWDGSKKQFSWAFWKSSCTRLCKQAASNLRRRRHCRSCLWSRRSRRTRPACWRGRNRYREAPWLELTSAGGRSWCRGRGPPWWPWSISRTLCGWRGGGRLRKSSLARWSCRDRSSPATSRELSFWRRSWGLAWASRRDENGVFGRESGTEAAPPLCGRSRRTPLSSAEREMTMMQDLLGQSAATLDRRLFFSVEAMKERWEKPWSLRLFLPERAFFLALDYGEDTDGGKDRNLWRRERRAWGKSIQCRTKWRLGQGDGIQAGEWHCLAGREAARRLAESRSDRIDVIRSNHVRFTSIGQQSKFSRSDRVEGGIDSVIDPHHSLKLMIR